METAVTKVPTGWVLSGEFDTASHEQLTAAFADLPALVGDLVELDLGAVSFIDSGGLSGLITLQQRVAATGGRVVIRNPSVAARRLLEVTKLAAAFGVNDCTGGGTR